MQRRQLLMAGAALAVTSWLRRAWATPPKRILVLGGSTFVGPAIVEAAVAAGHTVTTFSRGTTSPELFPHVEKLRGFRSSDPEDQDLSALAHRRFDVAIDVWPNDPAIVTPVANLLKEAGLAASTSEANRKIEEGAVKVDGARVTDRALTFTPGAEHVFQVGSRRFARLKLTAKG